MSKRLEQAYKLYNKDNYFSVAEAISLLMKYRKNCMTKFDEFVDADVLLGVDTNKSDQVIKSFVELPNGNGKKVNVLVFALISDDFGLEY